MIYKVTINDKLYEVEVDEGKANLLRTETIQAPVAIVPMPEAPAPAAVKNPAENLEPTGANNAYTAPMPGAILEIKVTKGQQIKENELLLVLEAMKMENEIYSQKSGTVAEVYVAKGAQVNTGDPLILIV